MAEDEQTTDDAEEKATGDAEPADAADHAADHAAADHGEEESIHMPPNSWWPLVTSIGICVSMLGLISVSQLPFIIVSGLVVMFIGIGGWVFDARREYHELH